MNTLPHLLEKANKEVDRHRQELLAAQRHHHLLVGLSTHLPLDLPYVGAHRFSVHAPIVLELAVDNFADAKSIAEALPPIAAVRYDDSCVTLKPAADHNNEREGSKRTPICPVWVTFQNITGPECLFEWFTTINGEGIKVEVKVKNVSPRIATWSSRVVNPGTKYAYTVQNFYHRTTADNHINWYSSDKMRVTCYWTEGTDLGRCFEAIPNAQMVSSRN